MRLTTLTTTASVLLLCLSACNDGETPDPIGVDSGTTPMRCSVDDQNRPEKAVQLTLGERYQGDTYICPPTDFDWYKIDIPTNSPLIGIELAFDMGTTSAVELAYDLYKAPDTEVPVASGRDEMPNDNRSSVTRTHYLDPDGGTYYLKVRDVADDEQDIRNPYAITVTAGTDPDTNEPNNDCANATPITGSATGVIAADSDKDAFSFDVPAGIQILDVHVTTTEASGIDFQVSLYEPGGTTFLARETDPFGEDGPTDVHLRHGFTSGGGTHCIIIEDDDGVESSIDTTYTVTVQVLGEMDPTEATARNDEPNTAVDLGSAGGNRTGMIASKADLDWYKVTTPVGQIISVDLNCPGCEIQPAVVFVYGHPDTPCIAGDQCDYLLQPLTGEECQVDTDCASGVCRQTPVGRQCGETCEGGLDCESFQCQQTGSVSSCTGVGFCTGENLCGIQQFARTGETGSVRTAQPAQAATTYILVHDFEDDEYATMSYNLTIGVSPDPDPNEPNNFYVPYTTFEAGDILSRGRQEATTVNWTAAGGRATATGQGCIAYEADIDIFRLAGGNPCAFAMGSTTGGSLSGDCGLQLTYNRPANSPVDLAYFLQSGGGSTRASFLASAEGTETVFGDGACGSDSECMVYFGRDNEDYYLVVRHFGQDAWSLDPAHCYTWTLTSAAGFGCPASCPDNNNPSNLCNCP